MKIKNWNAVRTAKNKTVPVVVCPDCKQPTILRHHTVTPHGSVSPSFVCLQNMCNFHSFIELVGWKP